MKRIPLSVRIVLLVFATSGVLVATMLMTVYQLMASDYEALVAKRESAEIARLASGLELSLQQRLLSLEAFAPRLLDDEGLLRSRRDLQAMVLRPSQAGTLFPDGLLVFDANATAIAENFHVPKRIGTNYGDRPHFQRAFQTKSAVISEPLLGRATGLPLISFLQPVLSENGDIMAFVGGVLDLSKTPLLTIRTMAEKETSVITFIIDPENRLFVSMQERFDTPKPLPAAGDNALVDAAFGVKPPGTLVEYQQQTYLIASERLNTLGWVVLRAIPYAEAIAPATKSFRRFLLISVIALVLIVLSGWLIARNLTQPIAVITRHIESMAGDARLDSNFPEKGSPEAKALARAMNRLSRERKAVEKLKDDFISSVSHELRTPLTSIHGGLKLLHAGVAGVITERAQSLIALSLRNSERLQVLISDLLDFNRLAAGKVAFKLRPCQLRCMAEQATADIAPTAREIGVHFRLSIPVDAVVQADEQRLRQVLDNILSNAIKHAPENSVIILTAQRTDAERWRLVVSDQGAGVPEEFTTRIFQRFAQADLGNKRAVTGAGLGLSIAKEMVYQMGGEIGFYNDKGAHFWFEMPAVHQTGLSNVEL